MRRSEAVRERQKNTSIRSFKRTLVASAISLVLAGQAHANPSGLSVAAGQASMQAVGDLLEVTNTPGAVLNWQHFNISEGETTRFIQQNAASHVLNRVVGGNPSEILGHLESNGQVYLINPAGLFVGKNAVIDTAGFLASTFSFAEIDNQTGAFSGRSDGMTDGDIVNHGLVSSHSGGSVVLLAPNIENTGVVVADGEVLLAAGHEVTLVDLFNPTVGVNVKVAEGEEVVNLGDLVGQNVSIFSSLFRNSGFVEATSAALTDSGEIVFKGEPGNRLVADASAGRIQVRADHGVELTPTSEVQASGTEGGEVDIQSRAGDVIVNGTVLADGVAGQGGEVKLSGERLAVRQARVSADGAEGGGAVFLGGGFRGQNSSIQNADQTVVADTALVSANALNTGDGGEVAVWANRVGSVATTIEAKGGAQGGDGGFVETSAAKKLVRVEAADTSASTGEAGTWLIDPPNLFVVNAVPSGGITVPDATGQFIADTLTDDNTYILASALLTSFGANNTVRLSAQDIVADGSTQPGNITIDAPILLDNSIAMFSSVFLQLEAQGDLTINAPIGINSSSIPGSLISLDVDLFSEQGNIVLNAPVGQAATATSKGINLTLTFDANRRADLNSLLDLGTSGSLNVEPFLNGAPAPPMGQLRGLVFNSGFSSQNILSNIFFNASPINPATAGAFTSATSFDVSVVGSTVQFQSLTDGSGTSPFSASNFTLSPTPTSPNPYRVFVGEGSGGQTGRLIIDDNMNVDQLTVGRGGEIEMGENTISMASRFRFRNGRIEAGGRAKHYQYVFVSDSLTIDPGGEFDLILNDSMNDRAVLGQLVLNGDLFMVGSDTVLEAHDVQIGGTLNLSDPFNPTAKGSAHLFSTVMNPTGVINIRPDSTLFLGSDGDAYYDLSGTTPKGFTSTTSGSQRADINLIGTSSPGGAPMSSDRLTLLGAELDFTRLGPALNASVDINVSGFGSEILSDGEGSGPSFPAMQLGGNVNINVQGPSNTKSPFRPDVSLYIAGFDPNVMTPEELRNEDLIDLDFDASLNISGGAVVLAGKTLDLTGTSSIDVQDGSLWLVGDLEGADLQNITRGVNADLVLTSVLNNTTTPTFDLLQGGDVLVVEDLEITNGLLGSGIQNRPGFLRTEPNSLLTLNNVDVGSRLELATQSYLLVSPDSTLNNTDINFVGDGGVLLATDATGIRNFNDSVAFRTSSAGNFVVAAFRSNLSSPTDVPTTMRLNLGNKVKFETLGAAQAPAALDALNLFYTGPIPARKAFQIGALPADVVAVAQFEGGMSPTTDLIYSPVDGTPYVFGGDSSTSFAPPPDCTIEICVGVDPFQQVEFNSGLTTAIDSSSLSAASLAFGGLVSSNTSIAFRTIQTGGDIINYGSGSFDYSPGDFDGVSSVVVDGTLRFTTSPPTMVPMPSFTVNGQMIVDASVTLGTGFTLAPGGSLVNSNTISLSGTSPVLLRGNVTNNGNINVLPGKPLDLDGNVLGTGVLSNAGQIALGSSALIDNDYSQTNGALLMFPGSVLRGNMSLFGGSAKIRGTVDGSVTVGSALFAPGNSPGLTTITGDLNLLSGSTTLIEVQGNGGVAGTDYDLISVGGTANLNGTLSVMDISALGAPGRNPSINSSGASLIAPQKITFLKANSVTGSFSAFNSSPRDSSIAFTQGISFVDSSSQTNLVVDLVSMSPSKDALTGAAGNTTNTSRESDLEQALVADGLLTKKDGLPPQDTPPPKTFGPAALAPPPASGGDESEPNEEEKEDAKRLAEQGLDSDPPSLQNEQLQVSSTRSNPVRPAGANICP